VGRPYEQSLIAAKGGTSTERNRVATRKEGRTAVPTGKKKKKAGSVINGVHRWGKFQKRRHPGVRKRGGAEPAKKVLLMNIWLD